MTFWGTDFFKSEDGEPVRYGSQVKVTILRQVDPDQADHLQGVAQIGTAILGGLVCLFVALLAVTGGSLVPIWLFVTSLTLLVHMVVLR